MAVKERKFVKANSGDTVKTVKAAEPRLHILRKPDTKEQQARESPPSSSGYWQLPVRYVSSSL